MTKSDVKKFLDTHRNIELSAERFEYSLHLYRDAEDFMFEEANKIFPRNQEERESIEKMIDEASSSDEIVKLLRKGLEFETCVKLIKKAMEIEEETLPIIQKKILTTGQDVFIENALKYLLRCKTNCCDWIVENYQKIRSEYMKSMLCLVLGFRGDASMIDFLIEEAKRFEREYPDETYDQGAALAVQELSVRFLN